jgi:molecular chaperone GrpE (heat shock protein)
MDATIEIKDLKELTSKVEDTRKSENFVADANVNFKLDGGLEFDCSEEELKSCMDIYKSMQEEFQNKFNETTERLEELEAKINNSACKCKSK